MIWNTDFIYFPPWKSPKPSSGLPGDRWRRCEEGDRWRRRVGHSEASRHRRQRRGAGALCHVGHLHDQHFASAMATWQPWWVKHHVKAMGIHLAEMLDLSIIDGYLMGYENGVASSLVIHSSVFEVGFWGSKHLLQGYFFSCWYGKKKSWFIKQVGICSMMGYCTYRKIYDLLSCFLYITYLLYFNKVIICIQINGETWQYRNRNRG